MQLRKTRKHPTKNPQNKPYYRGTNFVKGISQVKNVINAEDKEFKVMVLFLSDGMDLGTWEDLSKELKEVKAKYGEQICSWWNIGFGSLAEKSVLAGIIDILHSGKSSLNADDFD